MPRKVYQVIMQEALPEVNEWLSTYDTTID